MSDAAGVKDVVATGWGLDLELQRLRISHNVQMVAVSCPTHCSERIQVVLYRRFLS